MISQVLFHCNALVDLRNLIALQCKFNIRFTHLITSYPLSKFFFSTPFLFFGTFFTFHWNINSSTSSSLPFKIMPCNMWQQMTTSKRNRRFRFDLIKNFLHMFLNIPKLFFIVIIASNKPIVNAFNIKCHIPICSYGIINHGNNKYPLSSIT